MCVLSWYRHLVLTFAQSTRKGLAEQINSVNKTAGGTIYLGTNCFLAL